MNYDEIVSKIDAGEKVSVKDVSGIQLFRLFKDRHVRFIVSNNCTYEINILHTESNHIGTYITKERCPKYQDMINLIEAAITAYKTGHNCYVHFEEYTYQIIVEVMETDEI